MNDWVSKRVGTALTANPLVSKEMGHEFEKLLRNDLSERQLRPAEIGEIAKSLLANIEIISPKSEVKE